ncbi:tetratricopeptide repeat protein [Pseudarthrobacter sp. SSS035]|uniref:tetratricopeptide repeat protein n=1 Tax=Pseudarthrobacter sp. SSS035 TaxID=2931399 RepID=UPI00200C0E90|nr:tetratricopeptide repeat protein [Pseudarthrobacter sp. SSS035]
MADDEGEGARLIEPRLVKVRAGERGAGWAVGTRGVLTARHVVAPYLDHTVDFCLAVPDPRPGAEGFGCTVVWQDKDRDLALLAVDQQQMNAWTAAVGAGTGPRLAEPGTAPLDVEAVGYPDATIEEHFPHPEQVPGVLRPAGGAISGLMPLDVDGSVPEDHALWEGMSGAVVRDRATGRLVGVVLKADDDRQHRRLYVRPLPDPDRDAGFAAALAMVDAPSVLEAVNAPRVRRLLAVGDGAGRPYRVGQVPQLSLFGARRARTDVDTHGDPYYPFVHRDLDEDLAAALDRRVDGTDPRMLLLVGDAMSGKSRTGAQAVRSHPVLSNRALLIPTSGADLRDVVDLAPPEGAVLWLDDLNTFLTGLDAGVLRYCETRPGLVVVATLRSELLSGFLDRPELRPAWAVVDDNTLVERFALPGEWSEQDQQALAGVEPVIRNKVAAGLSLGEVLGAAEELQNRLAHADPFSRKAVAFTIIDWARTGLTEGIPERLAEELWPSYLSKKDALVVNNRDPEGRHKDFKKALKWVLAPIPDTATMLVTRTEGRLQAENYLVAHPLQEIPPFIWNAALDHATTAEAPATIAILAYTAAQSGVNDVANAAYRAGIDRGHPGVAPVAALGLGMLLEEQGNPDGAITAYQAALDSYHTVVTSGAAVRLGMLLEEQGNPNRAITAYQTAIESGHPEHAPWAAVRLGRLLAAQGNPDRAITAYQTAVDSRHPDYAPRAAVRMGMLLEAQGNPNRAITAYQTAVDSGHPERAPLAAGLLGMLLEEQGDLDGAITAYQAAVDSRHPDVAPLAAVDLGALLEEPGNTDRAMVAFRAEIAARLGALLAKQSSPRRARRRQRLNHRASQ